VAISTVSVCCKNEAHFRFAVILRTETPKAIALGSHSYLSWLEFIYEIEPLIILEQCKETAQGIKHVVIRRPSDFRHPEMSSPFQAAGKMR